MEEGLKEKEIDGQLLTLFWKLLCFMLPLSYRQIHNGHEMEKTMREKAGRRVKNGGFEIPLVSLPLSHCQMK